MVEYIIFPSSYFSTQNVDEDLQNEYDVVNEMEIFKTILFGYDKWFNEERLLLSEYPEKEVSAIYRGWMMKPTQYAEFYKLLLEKNIRLITTPKEYEKFHIFPNIYPEIENYTAEMLIYPDGTNVNLNDVKKYFKKFMVKDYVKSVKGTSFPKYFSDDVTQDEFDKQMKLFYQYRGGLYTGGICIKEYLDLKKYDGKTNEYRTFVANNQILSICKNSLQPPYTAELPMDFINRFTNLGSPLYTVDCAEISDGSWKILEVGDGQVSGLSDTQNIDSFFRGLYQFFK